MTLRTIVEQDAKKDLVSGTIGTKTKKRVS